MLLFNLDNEPPSLTCPSSIRTFVSADSSTAPVSYSVLNARDNSGGAPSVVCSPSSGNVFRVGDRDVTCTATDESGNSNECSFKVTVIGKKTMVVLLLKTFRE